MDDDIKIYSGGGYTLSAAEREAAEQAEDERQRSAVPYRRGTGYWIASGVNGCDSWVSVCLTRNPRERIQKREEPRSREEVEAAREDFAAYLRNYDARLAEYWADVEAKRQ